MMTPEEWDVACSMRDRYLEIEIISQACDLVKELFSNIESPAMTLLRNYAQNKVGEKISEGYLTDLLDDLRELLPSKKT